MLKTVKTAQTGCFLCQKVVFKALKCILFIKRYYLCNLFFSSQRHYADGILSLNNLLKLQIKMFGIEDPFILAPYLLMGACVIFAAWYGLKYWNKEDKKDTNI